MTTGTVKSIRTDRGFGFILPDNGAGDKELFFHHTSVANAGFDALREGQTVNYEEGADPRDPSRRRAVSVTPVSEAS